MSVFKQNTADSLLKESKYDELFRYCSEEAHKSDSTAMEYLSRCYLNGFGTEQNEVMAIRWCTLAAEKSNSNAQAAMESFSGSQLIHAYGTLANEGDTYAALCLALQYKSGKYINRDMNAAMQWFESAAQDYPQAQYELGLCFESSLYGRKNTERAIDLFLSAAENGYAPAKKKLETLRRQTDCIICFKKEADACRAEGQFRLAQCYEYGSGTEKDETYAFMLYSAAAEQGNTESQFRMGQMLESGRGTACKPKKAFEMYCKAANAGNTRAILRKAQCLQHGVGTEKDVEAATAIYRSECIKKNPIAIYRLAMCYEQGLTADEEARHAYRDLYENNISSTDRQIKEYLFDAQNGDADAQFCAAFLYECKHNEEDMINAYEQYGYAAAQGHVEAEFRLGRCYEFGLGAIMSDVQAQMWYGYAAEQSYVPACYRLATLIRTEDKQRSVELYSAAAQAGHAPSMCILTLIYETGDGTERSYSKASSLFEKAKKYKNSIMTYDILNCPSMGNAAADEYLHGLMYEVLNENSCECTDKYIKAYEMGFMPAAFRLAEQYAYGTGGAAQDAHAAFELYAEAAQAGHSEALYRLGECYENGFGTVMDSSAAFECYNSAAHSGSASAQLALGRFYESGCCCLQDRSEAFDWYRKAARSGNEAAREHIHKHVKAMKLLELDVYAARKGDPVAEYNLGKAYETGIDIEQNEEEAYKWYMRSAKHGYAQAQYVLGESYMLGRHFDINRKRAVYWYETAAKQGHNEATAKLQEYKEEQTAYYCYKQALERKSFLQKDKTVKIKVIIRLAQAGKAWAQYMYAVCLEFGYKMKASYEKAMELYAESARRGNAPAAYEMGQHLLYSKAESDFPQTALEYYKFAAGKKHAEACCMVGKCYEYGLGTERNLYMAHNYYEKAYELGDVKAAYALTRFYTDGYGVEKDTDKALSLCAYAANNGYQPAVYRLSRLMQSGKLTQCDTDAEEMCKDSAQCGFTDAQITYGLWCLRGSPVTKDEKKGCYYIKKAAKSRNSMALYLKAMCEESGYGIEKNIKSAFNCYKKAASLFNARAMYAYAVIAEKNVFMHPKICQSFICGAARLGEPHALQRLVDAEGKEAVLQSLFGIDSCTLGENIVSAKNGDAQAQYNVGLCLEYGLGTEKNGEKAIAMYKKAAASGSTDAMFRLYTTYISGCITDYDGEEAAAYCLAAAALGNTDAQYIVGKTSQNPDEAAYFMTKSALNGNPSARRDISLIYNRRMNVDMEAYSIISVPYIEEAAQQNDEWAQYIMGCCCEHAVMGEADAEKAKYYYALSANQGYAKAARRLQYLNKR